MVRTYASPDLVVIALMAANDRRGSYRASLGRCASRRCTAVHRRAPPAPRALIAPATVSRRAWRRCGRGHRATAPLHGHRKAWPALMLRKRKARERFVFHWHALQEAERPLRGLWPHERYRWTKRQLLQAGCECAATSRNKARFDATQACRFDTLFALAGPRFRRGEASQKPMRHWD